MNSENTENKILEEVQTVKKEYTLEKHVQTILLAMITASVFWVFQKVNDSNDRLIKMEERERMKEFQMTQMQQNVQKMQIDINDLKERMTKFEIQTR